MNRILTLALVLSWLISGLVIYKQSTRLQNLREIVSCIPIQDSK